MVKNMSGIVFNGLYLVQKEPSQGDKGLLVNGKYFIPVTNESSGAVASYYKCASVDTEAKTWSGYKAVFDSAAGTWSFESGITEGLPYTSVTPIVGGIYSADALVRVASLYNGIPTDGLVLYAPFMSDMNTAETGQAINYQNSVSFGTVDGIQCAHLTGSDISIQIEGISDISVSLFLKIPSGSGSWNGSYLFLYGGGNSQVFGLQAKGSNFYFSGWNNDFSIDKSIGTNFQHVCLTYNGNVVETYFNGIASTNAAKTLSLPTSSALRLGHESLDMYICALRVYNRRLDASEIALLAQEYSPIGV